MNFDPDIADVVRRIRGFDDLDDARVSALASVSSLRSVAEGAFFYEEDEESYDVFFIVSGIVGIRSRLPSSADEDSELITLRSGNLFGVLSFLDGARRDLNAVARERTLVLLMDGSRLKNACDADPTLGRAVYSLLGATASRRARDVAMELRNVLAERG